MAIPSVPTALSLVTEGLYQARIFNPNASQIARYQGEVMEQLKNELWQELKQSKPLMTFSYTTLVAGQSRYSCPADFSSDMTMVILTGLVSGTAVGGTSNALVVPVTLGVLDIDQTLGKDLCITGGDAANSVSQVIDVVPNNDGTTTLTVYPNFQAIPDSSSTFMLVDNQYPVEADHIANYDRFRSSGLDRPRKFYSMGDEDYDEFIFDCPPDKNNTYVVRMRYTVNIMTLDLASTLMSTLYQKFREYWIRGIKYQALSDNMDDEAPQSEMERKSKLQALIMSQQYGTDIRTMRQHVEDYY
jgi:hypothetical protein